MVADQGSASSLYLLEASLDGLLGYRSPCVPGPKWHGHPGRASLEAEFDGTSRSSPCPHTLVSSPWGKQSFEARVLNRALLAKDTCVLLE